MNQDKQHIPVLASEVVSLLNPKSDEHYLDLTAGYGGHARRMLDKIGSGGRAVLVDRDQNAIEHLTEAFGGDHRVEIAHEDFYGASLKLNSEGAMFDIILADIGLSSPHLDNASRGFSYSNPGPLDMRMDPRQNLTAADLINSLSKDELASILKRYGEIRPSERLAEAIIEERPVEKTDQLAGIINKSTPGYPKVRLEAQVFQALRIAVNDELEQLKLSLPIWHSMLRQNGRLAVISFHSLEDRIVKQYFQEHGGNRYDADLTIMTKQPVVCTPQESLSNPRARSAKLRVAQRK